MVIPPLGATTTRWPARPITSELIAGNDRVVTDRFVLQGRKGYARHQVSIAIGRCILLIRLIKRPRRALSFVLLRWLSFAAKFLPRLGGLRVFFHRSPLNCVSALTMTRDHCLSPADYRCQSMHPRDYRRERERERERGRLDGGQTRYCIAWRRVASQRSEFFC